MTDIPVPLGLVIALLFFPVILPFKKKKTVL